MKDLLTVPIVLLGFILFLGALYLMGLLFRETENDSPAMKGFIRILGIIGIIIGALALFFFGLCVLITQSIH